MHLITEGAGPHVGQSIATAGADLSTAQGALILVHGRGGNASDILSIAGLVAGPTIACFAPQAVGGSWYPHRFTEATSRNEPFLSSALTMLEALVGRLIAEGVPAERIALLGFSQGACLAIEFVVRRNSRLGAVLCLSGGLIGDALAPPSGQGLASLPVLLGCSERDAHIPLIRVEETDATLRALGADVLMRIYPGDAHDINDDEMRICRDMLAAMTTS